MKKEIVKPIGRCVSWLEIGGRGMNIAKCDRRVGHTGRHKETQDGEGYGVKGEVNISWGDHLPNVTSAPETSSSVFKKRHKEITKKLKDLDKFEKDSMKSFKKNKMQFD